MSCSSALVAENVFVGIDRLHIFARVERLLCKG